MQGKARDDLKASGHICRILVTVEFSCLASSWYFNRDSFATGRKSAAVGFLESTYHAEVWPASNQYLKRVLQVKTFVTKTAADPLLRPPLASASRWPLIESRRFESEHRLFFPDGNRGAVAFIATLNYLVTNLASSRVCFEKRIDNAPSLVVLSRDRDVTSSPPAFHCSSRRWRNRSS
jgi:hypothetical protein